MTSRRRLVALVLVVVAGCGSDAPQETGADPVNADVLADTVAHGDTPSTERPSADADGPAQDVAPPVCGPGTERSGDTCVDIDECLTDNGGCGDPARWTCVNQDGADPACEDVDECLADNGGCGDPAHWVCENREGAEPGCTYDPTADWMALTDGVYILHSGGSIPSALVLHADTAFPVVVDADGYVVVAAARHGDGTLLHFGHESHLGGTLDGQGDTAALIRNTVGWMGGDLPAPSVGVQAGYDGLVTFLQAEGLEAEVVAVDALDTVDIYVGDTYLERSDTDVAAIQAFVEGGGGLITGGHAWWWAQDTGLGLEEHMGNRLLAAMGMTLTGFTGASGEKVVGGAPKGALYHHHHALEHAVSHCLGSEALTDEEQGRALATVRLPLQALAANYSAYYDHARVIRGEAGTMAPSAETPMEPLVAPMCWLMVEFDHALAQGLPADEVVAHPCVEDFPYPVSADAERVSQALVIDASYAGRPWQYVASGAGEPVWRSTGLYAPAGEVVTVTVDAAMVDQGLSVLIGAHTDTLWHLESVTRFPALARAYPIDADEVRVASAFGGMIYIRVPGGTDLGNLGVVIDGGVRAARFVHGVTDVTEWQETIRHYPAPWAEIESDRVIILVPSVDVVDIDDPSVITSFWIEAMDAMADLEGSPHDRVRPERFALDRQISAGWLHSGYPVMGHDTAPGMLLDIATIEAEGSWGPFHEMGHNHQWWNWWLPGTTETTCNLWSVYVSETVLGIDRGVAHEALTTEARAERMAAYLASGPDFWGQWSVWTALETYLQLQEAFGWDFLPTVFTEYRAMTEAEAPGSDAEIIEEWVIRTSEAVGQDLTDFYLAWGLPLSADVMTSLTHLPLWTDHPLAD